jgi:MoaA/NifB/PqqE/SkfB family radical SAM enzyme
MVSVQDVRVVPQIKRHQGRNRERRLPASVIWDITYTCPLRCTHCYSESGRRPSRQLSPADILRVADVIIGMDVKAVFLSGGEPMAVKGLNAAIERWAQAGIAVYLFTSGWFLTAEKAAELAPLLAAFHISVDGATEEIHDKIRQREGSFERAMQALTVLNDLSRVRQDAGQSLQFGIDCTLIQSNFPQIEQFIEQFSARFPNLSFMNLGAAVPSGIAAEEWYAQHELLTEKQLGVLRRGRSAAAANPKLLLSLSDQRHLQMHPDDVASGSANVDTLSIEPDGLARAMSMYEGTVGNVLVDPPEEIWERAQARWHDPFVVEQLASARTRIEWATATRAIDRRYGSQDDLNRIANRLKVVP